MRIRSKSRTYLTKRLLISRSKKAVKEASERAFETAGYVVKVQGNQVVKISKDGSVVVIEQLDTSRDHQELFLD